MKLSETCRQILKIWKAVLALLVLAQRPGSWQPAIASMSLCKSYRRYSGEVPHHVTQSVWLLTQVWAHRTGVQSVQWLLWLALSSCTICCCKVWRRGCLAGCISASVRACQLAGSLLMILLLSSRLLTHLQNGGSRWWGCVALRERSNGCKTNCATSKRTSRSVKHD